MGIDMSPGAFAGMITVSPVRDTQLITVDVTGPDPQLDAALANALVVTFSEQVMETQSLRFASSLQSLKSQIDDLELQMSQTQKSIDASLDPAERDRLETRLDQYKQIHSNLLMSYENVRMTQAQTSSSLVQIESAIVPGGPIGPKTMQNTLLAAVVGAMLAVGAIFAFDALDDTLKTPEEISRRLKLPVMGAIEKFDEPDDGRLVTRAQPRSPVAESFRALRTNVQYASVDRPLRTLLVTSAAPGEGKTTVLSNLAAVLAQGGRQVTVVDADLHRPRIHTLFGTAQRPGLSGLFLDEVKLHLNGARQPAGIDRLGVVASGELPPNPSELLGSNRMRQILGAVLEQSERVLIDTPPVLSVTDAVVLAPLVDGVLVVARPGKTKMAALRTTIEQLRYVGANVVGVVLNGIDYRSARYGYYYKSHYYKNYVYSYVAGKTKDRT
jgi:non-specific protein-tyrosine kinase